MIIADVERLELQERQPRISDLEGQQMAQQNAAKVSQLVSEDFSQKNPQVLQQNLQTQANVPTQVAQPIPLQAPVLPPQAATYQPATYQGPIGTSTPTVPLYGTTVVSTSTPTVPFQGTTVVTQPLYTSISVPMMTYQPGTWATQSQFVAPTQVFAANQPVTHSISAPVLLTTPMVTNPSTGLVTEQVQHNEKERKLLTKKAEKCTKRANKESKRAEDDFGKARYYQHIGKADKALKYQASGEQHALASKHHQAWAIDAINLANSQTNIVTTAAPANVVNTGSSKPAL